MDICKAPLNTIAFSKALTYGNTQFYVYKQAISAFTPQPQSITALWLVLIYRPTEDGRLSRPTVLPAVYTVADTVMMMDYINVRPKADE